MIDPNTVSLEEKLKRIRIARKLYENLMAQAIRPEDIQTMREIQRLRLETEKLRQAAAMPKPAARPNDLGEALANIGSQPVVEAQPEQPAEEPPYTVDDAIRELRAAEWRKRR